MQSEYATSMFPDDITTSKHSIFYMVACSLGAPLCLCPTQSDTGWLELSGKLTDKLAKKSFLEIVPIEHHPETFFPLGTPITLRSRRLFEVFNLKQFQGDSNILPANCALDHVIWICPSGIVLIIGRLSSNDKSSVDLPILDDIVFQDHYAELGFVFNEIAEIIIDSLPPDFLRPPMCCVKDIDKIKTGIEVRREHGLDAATGAEVINWLSEHSEEAKLYGEQVVDVYFIDYEAEERDKAEEKDKYAVEYFFARVASCDPSYALMISITYSSFACLVWLVRHLGEQVRTLQTELVGRSRLSSETSPELKLLRIFCLRFINESNPINIRLKAEYMVCLDAGWAPYRMDKLIDQVNEQLGTLESIAGWIDDSSRANRDRKISVAAVLLSLVSITAVMAQLISTLDVESKYGQSERLSFIVLGLLFGCILSLLVLFMLPIYATRIKAKVRWIK